MITERVVNWRKILISLIGTWPGMLQQLPNIIRLAFPLGSMDDSDRLKQLYNDVIAKGPFPTEECGQARISAAEHGELILYLADVAGLASRGELGLASLSKPEKEKFRELVSRSISTRLPQVRERVTPDATPKLHALIEATEQARLLILDALQPQFT